MKPEPADAVALYRDMLRRGWKHNGDSYSWPIKLSAAMHLFAKEFGEELLDDLASLEARGRTPAEIARAFYNPARPYRLIDFVVYSMRRNRSPLGEQRAVVRKLLEMTAALMHQADFFANGRSLVHDPETARSIARSILHEPVRSLAESQLVHRFSAILWAYTESTLFRAHEVTKEFHGPYSGDGGEFIVKEYLNLQPTELWPDLPLLPCRTIKIYQQYRPPVRVRLLGHNRVHLEGGPPVPNLERWAIEIDGRPLGAAAIEAHIAIAQETIAEIGRRIASYGWNDCALKYAEIFWFRKKPLADLRGRDWRVPEHVRRTVRSGSENERRQAPLSDEACERLAMLTV